MKVYQLVCDFCGSDTDVMPLKMRFPRISGHEWYVSISTSGANNSLDACNPCQARIKALVIA